MGLRCKMSVFVYLCIFLIGMCISQDITSAEPEQEHTIAGETGSNVSILVGNLHLNVFECQGIELYFLGVTKETKREKKISVFYSTELGSVCNFNITGEYQQRISVQKSHIFEDNLMIYLRNVSLQDTGRYYATGERGLLGEKILFVSDRSVQTCVRNQMELHLDKSSSDYGRFVIGFYSGRMVSVGFLRHSHLPRFEEPWLVRISPDNIYVTLKSVELLDNGIYFLVGCGSAIIYDSVISNVIENGGPACSTTAITTGKPVATAELNTEMTATTGSRNKEIRSTFDIVDSTIPRQSFMFQHEYFVGAGVMAGIVFVSLTCIFICKRCRQRRRESQGDYASGNAHENIDMHYYSTIHNQDQGVSESIRTARSVPMSQQRTVVTDISVIYDGVRYDNITNVPSESTNQSETHYITSY